jgi:hypothetical protein
MNSCNKRPAPKIFSKNKKITEKSVHFIWAVHSTGLQCLKLNGKNKVLLFAKCFENVQFFAHWHSKFAKKFEYDTHTKKTEKQYIAKRSRIFC